MVTPTSVPTVSKISTKRNEKKTIKKFKVKMCEKSKCKKVGAAGRLIGVQPDQPFMGAVIPIGIPIRVVANTPSKIEPGTFRA